MDEKTPQNSPARLKPNIKTKSQV